ncbi:MAG: hypothetical protein ACYCU7_19025 [Acidimicrobiales bacterium]
MPDADAPTPATEIAVLKDHRSVLIRWGIRVEQRAAAAEAEVARLRAEVERLKEGAR